MLQQVLTISSVLETLALIESFGLLYLADSVMHLELPLIQTVLFAIGGGSGAAISWTLIGYIWLYTLVWMVVQDAMKLGLYRMLEHRRTNRGHWQASLHEPLDPHRGLHHAKPAGPGRP